MKLLIIFIVAFALFCIVTRFIINKYRKAAEQGDARAQYQMGVCYAKGIGVAQNHVEAVKWYRMAAEQGYARAQYNLGMCYAKSQGVTLDYGEAIKWYKKAAAQGFEPAQEILHDLGY